MCLTDEQERRFDEWIAKHKVACPICHGTQFVHLEPVMERRYSLESQTWPNDPIKYPLLRLLCPTCANVLHFAARPILNLPEQGAKFA